MNTYTSLLAGIISNPDDDTARLVFADYLDERAGESGGSKVDAKWAAYIRAAIKLHQHKSLGIFPVGSANITGREFYKTGIELSKELHKLWTMGVQFHDMFNKYAEYNWGIARGFISEVSCTASQFLTLAPKLIWHESMGCDCPSTAHPVRKIEVALESGQQDANMFVMKFKNRKCGIGLLVTTGNNLVPLVPLYAPTPIPNPPPNCVVVEQHGGTRVVCEQAEPLRLNCRVTASKNGRVYRIRRRGATHVALGTVVAVHVPTEEPAGVS